MSSDYIAVPKLSRRRQARVLQDVVQLCITRSDMPAEVVIAGLGEFLVHYAVTKRGTEFAGKFLDTLVEKLEAIQGSVALVSVESDND